MNLFEDQNLDMTTDVDTAEEFAVYDFDIFVYENTPLVKLTPSSVACISVW